MVYARLTVAPLQASWFVALSLNLIVAPVNEPVPLPAGTSAFTFIVVLASVKSLASHVPAGAPTALVTDAMLTLTPLTWIGPELVLSKSPEMVWAPSPGYIAVNV